MKVIEIVSAGLVARGYEGLYSQDEQCGCCLNDLSPGNCLSESCDTAYRHALSTDPEQYVMSASNEPKTDAEILEILNSI